MLVDKGFDFPMALWQVTFSIGKVIDSQYSRTRRPAHNCPHLMAAGLPGFWKMLMEIHQECRGRLSNTILPTRSLHPGIPAQSWQVESSKTRLLPVPLLIRNLVVVRGSEIASPLSASAICLGAYRVTWMLSALVTTCAPRLQEPAPPICLCHSVSTDAPVAAQFRNLSASTTPIQYHNLLPEEMAGSCRLASQRRPTSFTT